MIRKVAKGMPAFVTADFNSDEKSRAYKVLQNSSLLSDTMDHSPVTVNKECQSISGYKPITTRPMNGMHIDHVFFTPNSIKIKHWELIVKDYNGYWGSDHHPIFVDCTIAN
jgi:endonuclease/exonuclease/phosphatase family metal-dependent hydrolase